MSIRRGVVLLDRRRVGVIEETADGRRTRFTYDPAWLASKDAEEIALTMALRPEPYEAADLLPFFANLLPFPSDGHFRQALVLCHMMLPRGKRALKDVGKEVTRIYERNIASWEDDYKTLTKGVSSRAKTKPKAKPAAKKKSKSRKR